MKHTTLNLDVSLDAVFTSFDNDIIFSQQFAIIRIIKDKNVTTRPRYGLVPGTWKSFNLAGAIRNHISSLTYKKGFVTSNGISNGSRPWADYSSLFTSVNHILNVPSNTFSAYSFRKGGATSLLEDSTDISTVAYAGGWKSTDSVQHYVQQTPKFLFNLRNNG
jgi:hypothetical protein